MSMHQLIVADGQRAREIFDICRVRTLIGRAVGTDVQVRTPLASRMHALLSVQEDGVYVSDLDSFNGTYLNGRKVVRARVQHLDVIRVGDCDIRFVEAEGNTKA